MDELGTQSGRSDARRWLLLGAMIVLPGCILGVIDADEAGESAGTENDPEEFQRYTILATPEELSAPLLVDLRGVTATNDGFYFHALDQIDAGGRSHVGKIPYYAESTSCADWCYLDTYAEGELVLALDANRAADSGFSPLVLYSDAEHHRVQSDDVELSRATTDILLKSVAAIWGANSSTFAAATYGTFIYDAARPGPDGWRALEMAMGGADFMVGGRDRVYVAQGTKVIEIFSESKVLETDFAGVDVLGSWITQIVPDGDGAWAIVGTVVYHREADTWRGVLDLADGSPTATPGALRIAVDENFVYGNFGKAWNKSTGDLCRYLLPPDHDDLESVEVVLTAYSLGVLAVGGGVAYSYLPAADAQEKPRFVRLQLPLFGEPFCDPWQPLF